MLVSLMCVCMCVCVCVCVEKRWVRWSEEGKSSNLGRGRRTLWPHMPSIFKLIKCGPGGTLGFVSRTLSLYQASIQDTEKQSRREELKEAGLGEVMEITLGVAGWGVEGKDPLEIQRP